ncbi:FMN reductase (NADH) NtaB [wastewater metagenome]|uniref:FMN reductase (NADH) NtaB n=2 Tax=unclassified sequences TaxID=12908 RepID=A0A5B8RAL9_9ZZZZ|nr:MULTISPECIES: flavin reductase family protein [Arhodomonas]MCS4502732.1 flavin reductase family protein [Arhodomonas aquaeolei]QEA03785.1 FMN reductase (NADH) NtaB [uncultured organism]
MATATALPMHDDTTIDPQALRNALGCFATGVTIVTTRGEDGSPVGLTVNSFSSVSLEPPLVLWSLVRRSPSRAAFERATHFTVNVLTTGQRDLSQRFATARPDKFEGVRWWAGAGGAPVIEGCLAHFQCRQALRYDGGDHDIFLGRVEDFDASPAGEPLVFVTGRYHQARPADGPDKTA